MKTHKETTQKTIPARECSTFRMQSGGKGKPTHVIDEGQLKEYVGIGWITLRKATAADRRRYPTVI